VIAAPLLRHKELPNIPEELDEFEQAKDLENAEGLDSTQDADKAQHGLREGNTRLGLGAITLRCGTKELVGFARERSRTVM
jgi:hypothetical protein